MEMDERDESPDDQNTPDKYLENVIHYLMHGAHPNDTVDFRQPQVRHALLGLYPLFLFLYSLVMAVGVLANCAMVYVIARDRLYRDQTFGYFINLAVSDLVKCLVVLPLSLMVLLIQNWIFGSFLCYFLPMMQDIPMHVTTLTHVLIALDRFRFLQEPASSRIPAFVMATGCWLMALCIVLPYPIYTTYVDLGQFKGGAERHHQLLTGVGLCALNLADDMYEYVRGLFFAMYVLPLATTAYLYVRMSHDLERKEGPSAVFIYDARSRAASSASGGHQQGQAQFRYRSPTANFDLFEAELDVRKERHTQRHLIATAAVYGVCLCPLMVLRLAKMAVAETYANTGHFDVTFAAFVWIAFLPACATPLTFIYWRMNRSTKERLRGYFRMSNRHFRRRAGGGVATTSGDTPPARRHSQRSGGAGGGGGRNSDAALSTDPVIGCS